MGCEPGRSFDESNFVPSLARYPVYWTLMHFAGTTGSPVPIFVST